jgi:hypothetical protein
LFAAYIYATPIKTQSIQTYKRFMSGIEELSSLAINVKANHNSDLRRFVLTSTSLPVLYSKLTALFSLSQETAYGLLYADDEGDLVTIASDVELQHAVELSKGLLRLEVVDRGAGGELLLSRQGRGFAMRGKGGRGCRGKTPYDLEHRGRGRDREEKSWKEKKDRKECKERGFGKDKLIARHVKDVTIMEGTSILPGTPFTKTWRIRNEGVEWPEGCRLLFVSRRGGDIMGAPDFVPIEGKVAPGAEIDVSVQMVAPKEAGKYVGFWRLSDAEGKKFGQRFSVAIVVGAPSSSEEEPTGKFLSGAYDDLVKQLEQMGFGAKPRRIERLLVKHGGNVTSVAEILAAAAKAKKEPKGSPSHRGH